MSSLSNISSKAVYVSASIFDLNIFPLISICVVVKFPGWLRQCMQLRLLFTLPARCAKDTCCVLPQLVCFTIKLDGLQQNLQL